MSQIQPYGTPETYQNAGVPAVPTYGGTPAQQWGPGYAQGMPAMMTDPRPVDGAVVAVAWVCAVLTAGYMLPWAVAVSRGKANHGAIAVIDLLLGWSIIGWVVALVMACQAHQVVAGPGAMNVVVAQQFTQPAPAPAGPAAGWYPAPDGAGQQYWDGAAWTGHRAP